MCTFDVSAWFPRVFIYFFVQLQVNLADVVTKDKVVYNCKYRMFMVLVILMGFLAVSRVL